MEKQSSSQLNDLRIVAYIYIFWIIWKMKNNYDISFALSYAFSILSSNCKS